MSRDTRCVKSHRTIVMCVKGGSLVQHQVREDKAVSKLRDAQAWALKAGVRGWHLHTVGTFPRAVRRPGGSQDMAGSWDRLSGAHGCSEGKRNKVCLGTAGNLESLGQTRESALSRRFCGDLNGAGPRK